MKNTFSYEFARLEVFITTLNSFGSSELLPGIELDSLKERSLEL